MFFLVIISTRIYALCGAGGAEVLEIGPGDLGELLQGKEADGIIGDFVLRNGRIEALVAGNLPGRKANMAINWNQPTPGCLYDLDLRGSKNDQLACVAPGGLEGPVSWVRIIGRGPRDPASPASVLVERTAAMGGGLYQSHEYRLGSDSPHLLVISTYENRRGRPVEVKPQAVWKGLSLEVSALGIRAADAMDPMDRQGYALSSVEVDGAEALESPVTLKPGEKRRFAVAIAPGRSPAEAFGQIAAVKFPTGVLRCRVRDRRGDPIATAAVEISIDGKILPAYPDPSGAFEVRLPPGDYFLTARDAGRPRVRALASISAGSVREVSFTMDEGSRIRFEVTGADGGSIPSKVQFIGIGGTKDPDLGPAIRAHGSSNQYHSETGRFAVPVPPGKYRIAITRGIEFDHHEEEVDVPQGKEVLVRAKLRRVVDTRGWISTDFHSHSTPSGDNYCGVEDRIANLAAEGVEFAPTTEHNRFYDRTPAIARLGLQKEISTIPGIELTGSGPHLNAFPMKVVPGVQDGGAPAWVRDPRIDAMVLRDWDGGGPERWVQLNHPSVGEFFRDRDGDGRADGGYSGLESLIDAAEVWSADILIPVPIRTVIDFETWKIRVYENRTFAWLQLLNQGRRLWCVAVSDAHGVFASGTGGWRSYVPSSTDEPAGIDAREIIRNAKAGRMLITNGPFLEASLEDGTMAGGTTVGPGGVNIRVRVQTNTWIDIDRVQVIANGRLRPNLNFTRRSHPELFRKAGDGPVRFEAVIPVVLTEDSWLIAVAYGEESDLKKGYGRAWGGGMHPCAFHNPIFVDVDGGGFRPNGDTLGYPLPVAFPPRKKL